MLLTVLMPVYNAEQYLNEAIDSILNQSFRDFEFLIIDDGSTDNSVKIISSYNDRRIRLVRNDCNKGLIYTLNRGFAIATGDYIARMDADDISISERLKIQMEYLLSHASVDLCGCSSTSFGSVYKDKKQYFPLTSEMIKAEALFNSPFNHPSVIMKTSLARQYKYKEEYKYAEDYALWQEMIGDKRKMVNLPYILYKYRKYGGSQTDIGVKDRQKRFAIISKIQTIGCRRLGINNDLEGIKLHYYLSLTNNILDMKIDKSIIVSINSYFNKLLVRNKNIQYCKQSALLMILGKIWLKVVFYKRAELDFKSKCAMLNNKLIMWGIIYMILLELNYKIHTALLPIRCRLNQ